jgi:hypothetical protein
MRPLLLNFVLAWLGILLGVVAGMADSIGARLWDERSEYYKTRSRLRNAKGKP